MTEPEVKMADEPLRWFERCALRFNRIPPGAAKGRGDAAVPLVVVACALLSASMYAGVASLAVLQLVDDPTGFVLAMAGAGGFVTWFTLEWWVAKTKDVLAADDTRRWPPLTLVIYTALGVALAALVATVAVVAAPAGWALLAGFGAVTATAALVMLGPQYVEGTVAVQSGRLRYDRAVLASVDAAPENAPADYPAEQAERTRWRATVAADETTAATMFARLSHDAPTRVEDLAPPAQRALPEGLHFVFENLKLRVFIIIIAGAVAGILVSIAMKQEEVDRQRIDLLDRQVAAWVAAETGSPHEGKDGPVAATGQAARLDSTSAALARAEAQMRNGQQASATTRDLLNCVRGFQTDAFCANTYADLAVTLSCLDDDLLIGQWEACVAARERELGGTNQAVCVPEAQRAHVYVWDRTTAQGRWKREGRLVPVLPDVPVRGECGRVWLPWVGTGFDGPLDAADVESTARRVADLTRTDTAQVPKKTAALAVVRAEPDPVAQRHEELVAEENVNAGDLGFTNNWTVLLRAWRDVAWVNADPVTRIVNAVTHLALLLVDFSVVVAKLWLRRQDVYVRRWNDQCDTFDRERRARAADAIKARYDGFARAAGQRAELARTTAASEQELAQARFASETAAHEAKEQAAADRRRASDRIAAEEAARRDPEVVALERKAAIERAVAETEHTAAMAALDQQDRHQRERRQRSGSDDPPPHPPDPPADPADPVGPADPADPVGPVGLVDLADPVDTSSDPTLPSYSHPVTPPRPTQDPDPVDGVAHIRDSAAFVPRRVLAVTRRSGVYLAVKVTPTNSRTALSDISVVKIAPRHALEQEVVNRDRLRAHLATELRDWGGAVFPLSSRALEVVNLDRVPGQVRPAPGTDRTAVLPDFVSDGGTDVRALHYDYVEKNDATKYLLSRDSAAFPHLRVWHIAACIVDVLRLEIALLQVGMSYPDHKPSNILVLGRYPVGSEDLRLHDELHRSELDRSSYRVGDWERVNPLRPQEKFDPGSRPYTPTDAAVVINYLRIEDRRLPATSQAEGEVRDLAQRYLADGYLTSYASVFAIGATAYTLLFGTDIFSRVGKSFPGLPRYAPLDSDSKWKNCRAWAICYPAYYHGRSDVMQALDDSLGQLPEPLRGLVKTMLHPVPGSRIPGLVDRLRHAPRGVDDPAVSTLAASHLAKAVQPLQQIVKEFRNAAESGRPEMMAEVEARHPGFAARPPWVHYAGANLRAPLGVPDDLLEQS